MKRGVSKIMIAVTESSPPDWPQIRLELYGFRAGIVLSHFLVAVFLLFFFDLLVLALDITLTNYIRNVWIRDQGVHCFKLNVWLFKVTDIYLQSI